MSGTSHCAALPHVTRRLASSADFRLLLGARVRGGAQSEKDLNLRSHLSSSVTDCIVKYGVVVSGGEFSPGLFGKLGSHLRLLGKATSDRRQGNRA